MQRGTATIGNGSGYATGCKRLAEAFVRLDGGEADGIMRAIRRTDDERKAYAYRGARGTRTNFEFSSHFPHPFPHAGDADPTVVGGFTNACQVLLRNATAIIADFQREMSGVADQNDARDRRTRMPMDVGQALLQYAK